MERQVNLWMVFVIQEKWTEISEDIEAVFGTGSEASTSQTK